MGRNLKQRMARYLSLSCLSFLIFKMEGMETTTNYYEQKISSKGIGDMNRYNVIKAYMLENSDLVRNNQ